MRLTSLLAAGLVLIAAAPAGATQLSYVDQGQVWVSTLDGSQKRAISGPAPQVVAGEGREWMNQAQSDDGWIFAVAYRPGSGTGEAGPTALWRPDGSVAAQSTLGYGFQHPSAIYPGTIDLSPGGKWVVATWSDLQGGTLFKGTWVMDASQPAGTGPFEIPNLLGTSFFGDRWIGVNRNLPGGDVWVQKPGYGAPASTEGNAWLSAPTATNVDIAANGSVAGVIYNAGTTYNLALGGAAGPDAPLTGTGCDLPAVGSVQEVSISQDGAWLAWRDDRGLLVAPTPPLGSGDPCPMAATPTLISATGRSPSLGASTLATPSAPSPGMSGAPAPGSSGPTTPATTGSEGGSAAVTVSRRLAASRFSKGVPVTVQVTGAGKVTVTAKVGSTVLARAARKAKAAGVVKVTLKSTKALSRRLRSYRWKTVTIGVKGPGVTVKVKRKLK